MYIPKYYNTSHLTVRGHTVAWNKIKTPIKRFDSSAFSRQFFRIARVSGAGHALARGLGSDCV